MSVQQFNSIKELAEYLDISRTTLYKRAKESGVKLNGRYSNKDLEQLSGVQLTEHNVDDLNTEVNKDEQLLNTLLEQLKIKDQQIESLNNQLEVSQKLVDQSQQLQLQTQMQLESEKNKVLELETTVSDLEDSKISWWKRLFS